MATYDEMFGKKSGGSGNYIQWKAIGEALFFRVTGEPREVPQVNFKTKKAQFMVQAEKEGAYRPMDEGTFNPDEVEWSKALMEWAIPVTVFQKKGADGEMVEGFEEFSSDWIPNLDQTEKLKNAMLETELGIEAGVIIAVKWAAEDKPRKYVVKLAAGE